MTLVIGLDTGGTYTDAALLDTATGTVRATGKSLTTRDDLSIGVGGAIRRVLEDFDGSAADIGLVSLSTTLATNAVVEGVGGRVSLLMIGFDETSLQRADLARALGQDPVFFINGGHAADGAPQAQLDEAAIREAVNATEGEVSAYAVAGHFATRNPAHESRTRDLLRDLTGAPVTCSHELSSSLGGPRRALTAVLNARLINLLDRLVAATEGIMADEGLSCQLMVVKGDGSLLESGYARSRPVETVLSGPAASLAGAAFLAGTRTAMVADIGGTTTDIALLQNGAPRLKPDGALVGGWQTMVEAADIRTCGLGGDSEVTPVGRGTTGGLTLGPRRAVPLSLLATPWPEVKDKLAELGIIFCSMSEAIQEHPELVRQHLGTVIPVKDNFFSALNSAVFTDGSFCYIPKGVKCPMELSTYFRINEAGTGQFERTLVVAEEGSYVSYLEGCTAPQRDENQLHAACVELIAKDDAEIKSSTVQNWYPGDAEGKGGVFNFVTKRGICEARAKISWTQVETGSAVNLDPLAMA